MKIETYEIEPQNSEIGQLADDGEHRLLCEQLGLSGQLSLSSNETKTIFPYRHMTALEKIVYELHCPHSTKLDEYKSDAIPTRVLQVAAHALSCKVLNHIRVWHPTDAKLDPVLVGYTGPYGGDLYLLARWGAVWKDFSVLVKEAKTLWITKRRAKIERAEKQVATAKSMLASDAEAYFLDGTSDFETSIYI